MKIFYSTLSLLFILCCPAHSLWAAESKDVCAYVANAYNNHQEKEIFKPFGTIDIYNDGRPVQVAPIPEGSHGGYSLGVGKDKNGVFHEMEEYDPYGIWKLDKIHVVSFKGRNYIVAEQDRGPIDVTDLGKGNICRFHWIWQSAIDEDNDPAICAKAVSQEKFSEIPIEWLYGNNHKRFSYDHNGHRVMDPAIIDLVEYDDSINDRRVDVPGFGEMPLYRAAYMKLDGVGDHVSVGELIEMLPGGIKNSLLTLLNNGKISRSKQNIDLLQAQENFLKADWGGGFFPVRIGDKNLIEADHPVHYNQITPPRSILTFKRDHIVTLCKISENVIYSVAPAYFDMKPRNNAMDLETMSVGTQRYMLEKEQQKKSTLQKE